MTSREDGSFFLKGDGHVDHLELARFSGKEGKYKKEATPVHLERKGGK